MAGGAKYCGFEGLRGFARRAAALVKTYGGLFDVVSYDANSSFSRANADAVIAAGKDYLFARGTAAAAADALDPVPVREAVRRAVGEDDGKYAPPPVEPHPLAVAERAGPRALGATAAGADHLQVRLNATQPRSMLSKTLAWPTGEGHRRSAASNRDGRGELVLLRAVPYAEHESAARPQHSTASAKTLRTSGKNITPSWQDLCVGRRVAERQAHRIRLAPLEGARRSHRRGEVEHRLVQVGGDETRVGRSAASVRPRRGARTTRLDDSTSSAAVGVLGSTSVIRRVIALGDSHFDAKAKPLSVNSIDLGCPDLHGHLAPGDVQVWMMALLLGHRAHLVDVGQRRLEVRKLARLGRMMIAWRLPAFDEREHSRDLVMRQGRDPALARNAASAAATRPASGRYFTSCDGDSGRLPSARRPPA
jgi:hypothetical protein